MTYEEDYYDKQTVWKWVDVKLVKSWLNITTYHFMIMKSLQEQQRESGFAEETFARAEDKATNSLLYSLLPWA